MSTALIQLSKGKKSLVSFGAIMLIVAVACYGLALMTLVPPILQRLDGMSFADLVGLCISLGITLLSPIGGTGCSILAGILTDMGMQKHKWQTNKKQYNGSNLSINRDLPWVPQANLSGLKSCRGK